MRSLFVQSIEIIRASGLIDNDRLELMGFSGGGPNPSSRHQKVARLMDNVIH